MSLPSDDDLYTCRHVAEFNGEFCLFIGPDADTRRELEIHSRLRRPWLSLKCLLCRTDFFISYRISEAETYARNLARSLENLGYTVFMAGLQDDLPSEMKSSDGKFGGSLGQALRPALRDARVIIIIESKTLRLSHWVGWENEVFDEERGLIFCPLHTKVTGFPYLQAGKMLPLLTPDTSDFSWGVCALIQRANGVAVLESRSAWDNQEPEDQTVRCIGGTVDLFINMLIKVLLLSLTPKILRPSFHGWLTRNFKPGARKKRSRLKTQSRPNA